MFKYQKVFQKSSLKKALVLWHPKKYQSTKPRGNELSKLAFGAAALTGVATVGLVGYVTLSNNPREKVENKIAGSKTIFDFFLGPLDPATPSTSTPQNQDVSLLQKKLERERNKIEEEAKTDDKKSPIIEPPPLPNVNEIIDTHEALPSRLQTDEKESHIEAPPLPKLNDAREVISDGEKGEAQISAELNARLEHLITEAKNLSSEAMSAANDLCALVRVYFEKAHQAIDSIEGQEALYSAASEAATLREESTKIAEEKLSTARQSISNLRSAIGEGRQNQNIENDPVLLKADAVVNELTDDTAKIVSMVSENIKDCSAIVELRDIVEAARRRFEMEEKSLVPDWKAKESGEPMTVDELTLLLAHAHKKVILMQGVLARNQTLDKDKQHEVEASSDYDSRFADAKLKTELERQKMELSTLHRHRMAELQEELDSQLHGQLKRQAAAFSDHLTDALRLQQSELDRRWKNIMHDGLQQKQTEYNTALSSIDGQLSGLKEGIESRAAVIEDAITAQTLWVACESLQARLRLSTGETWEEKLEPLQKNVDAIKKAAGNQKEFVDVVLDALPDDSLTRGVYTEESLRERFIKVERICRRVALIGDGGGSLVRYFISYVRSFLLADEYDLLSSEQMRDEEIDLSELSTFDILARTKFCLEKDDFLQSIKYMKLLRGEPRNVASDWVREALLTTEARQAADVLMALAAATAARAL